MKISNILCAIGLCVLTCWSASVYAEGGKQGAYVSGQVGLAWNRATFALAEFSQDYGSSSDNIFTWGANAGYNYQVAPEWLLGGQIGYTSLGSASWSVPGFGSFHLSYDSINALATVTRLLGKHWYIWGEGGYVLGMGHASGSGSSSESISTGALGAGFGYQWQHITAYFRYDHFFGRNENATSNSPVFPPVDTISLGVGYIF